MAVLGLSSTRQCSRGVRSACQLLLLLLSSFLPSYVFVRTAVDGLCYCLEACTQAKWRRMVLGWWGLSGRLLA